jgi:uncharacterized membrane protein
LRARQMWPLWLLCGVLVAVFLAGLALVVREDLSRKDDVSETALPAGQDLRIALDHLAAGRLYLFSFPGDLGRRIRFVAQRTSDGAVHAAMASCQACYRSERPHYTHNGQVICGMCNQPMPRPDEKGLTLEQKQCALVSLPHSMHDNEVSVSAQSILDQSRAMEAQ